MDVALLGSLRIRDGDAEIPAGGPHQRRLLARLGIAAGETVAFDELEAAVWGDEPPPTSRHTLAAYVSRLRHLGLEIGTSDRGYRLVSSTDVAVLERLAGEGRQALDSDPARAAGLLRAALALWRGGLTADLELDAAGLVERARLEDLVAGLREDLLSTELDAGEPDAGNDLVAAARGLTGEEPYRERRWELLMLALYRSGRQADALDAYAECRRRLIDELGIEPGPGLRRMQQAVLAQDPALDTPSNRPSAVDAPSTRLPGAATRLIGRTMELGALMEVWDRARAVTLIGPPGAGKTRLAVEAARGSAGPVWYVSVEQLALEQSVAAAILDVVAPSSMAIDARQGLIQELADRSGLLVLDGCERRRADVADDVARILGACPSVRVLATSRERLGLIDEALIPVGPLSGEDALELLVDRARLVDPRFELRPDELVSAEHLCGLVDRLPLGLELVARHLNLLSLGELAERVEADVSRWAGGPAQGRTGLWAALDASMERLTHLERRVMVALAVMVADADAELIARVIDPTDPDLDIFDAIARLVDASLVQVRSAVGSTRYELLRTVRIHTLESADEALVAACSEHYRAAVLERALGLSARLATPERPTVLVLLDREMPHIRAALAARAVEAPSERTGRALEVTVALTDYWLGRHPAEGLEWLVRLRDAARPASELRARAALSGAHLAYWLTDFAAGRTMAEDARAEFAAIGDPLGEGRALRRLGAIAAATDDVEAARTALEASVAALESAGVERETGTTLLHLGSLLADQGLSDQARTLLARSLAIASKSGDPLARGHALAALNLADWKGGDLDAAMRDGEAALAIFRDLGHRPTEGTVSYRLAAVARGLGRPRAARQFALQAIDAGEQSRTRTTVALGYINLARLDLDERATEDAARHLHLALGALDPVADRWVLVDGLEVAARLAIAADIDGAGPLLATAADLRAVIHQPVAPTEEGDVQEARRRAAVRRDASPPRDRAMHADEAVRAAAAHAAALGIAQGLMRPHAPPTPIRRARA